ncbi:hypothetical protein QOZ80_4BG0334450 [Eleusine coracana subsp. coracana]|nr:hypothetical protein QOZ80_4BG0334450 [Eleusine coracana subsp. coracana]
MVLLINMVSMISEACRNVERLPAALIWSGIIQAAAALALVIFKAPGGIFLHHGKAPIYLYYGILIAVVIFGLVEASAGFWVSDAWLRQVGLADQTEKLSTEIERIETVVTAVKGRTLGNKPLLRSLARLKELLYDADDLVDELDYYRLEQQVNRVTSAPSSSNALERTDGDATEQAGGSTDNPDMRSTNKRKNPCKEWDDFDVKRDREGRIQEAECKYCRKVLQCPTGNGTSVLRNHLKSKTCPNTRAAGDQQPNTLSIGDSINSISTKRLRFDKGSTHNRSGNTYLWDKAQLCNRIEQIALQLHDIRLDVNGFLNNSNAMNHCPNNTSYPRLRTSSLVPCKIYGRKMEKDYMIRVMRTYGSDTLTVLPIVGIGGVGKTALAQFLYNDPTVKSQYQRAWVWVSDEIDEVTITRNMLGFFSPESNRGTSSYAKLQEILKGHMDTCSNRFLLVLDDVWNNMDYYRWNELLAPLRSSATKGNVIIVTTRNLFLAEMTGTVKPIKLGALKIDDVRSFFEALAFGDDNDKGNPTLEIIGRQIVEKLKGSPLAVETAGNILRKQLTVDYWSNILKNEEWKSLQHNRGIMLSLKLSYDQLPYKLQKCLLYCSIFPYKYQFLAEDLIDIWISQGFVRCDNSSKIEDTGQEYLNDLVDWGFFEQADTRDSQICYIVMMPALIHEFARLVSRTECAVIDSVECNEIPPTVRHLSILTDSAYHKDHTQHIHRNERFEEKLRSVVKSVRKLRTLLLIGNCDHFFLRSFQHIFEKAKYLRMLQISSTYASLDDALVPNLVNSTHIRYLKVETKGSGEALHIPLSKFYHLEVLDARDTDIPDHMNGLVSMRLLV